MPEASSNVSLIILAGLLSFLPVAILLWVYYLREREPTVQGPVIIRFFFSGMLTVLPAIFFERSIYQLSQAHPATASAFFTEFVSLERPLDLALAFVAAFGVVALVEEGVRFFLLRFLFRRAQELDQVVDGVQVGVAAGLGFAFVENALYFLRLFQRLDFDTLAIVFFLRFLVSTFGHISFGGIMGYELARAVSEPLERRSRLWRAFLIPWGMHGLFDFLLSVQLSSYTVLFLLLPLLYLWSLYQSPVHHERFRLHGRVLRARVWGRPWSLLPWRRPLIEALPVMPWCPTCLGPLSDQSLRCRFCGTRFHRKLPPSVLPYTALPAEEPA